MQTIGKWVTALLLVIGIGVGVEAGVGLGMTAEAARYGEACGVTALGGGAPAAVGVKYPALLHVCATGQHQSEKLFVLVSSTGTTYRAAGYPDDGWSARLPAGTYRADRIAGCPGYEKPFTVGADKTTLGVVVWWGCEYK